MVVVCSVIVKSWLDCSLLVNNNGSPSRYYDQIARVLDELEEADRSLGPLQEMPSGLLRVSAPTTLTLICLSSALPKFLSRYPELTLDLRMDDRRVNIVEEDFDIAIRASDSLEDSSLIARKLMTMPHVVCGAPPYLERFGAPAAPEDLKDHSCIQFTLSGHADDWEFRNAGLVVASQLPPDFPRTGVRT